MLYTKIQPWSFLGSGEEDFEVFLPYMGMAAILLNDVEPFEQTEQIWQKAQGEIWWKFVKLFQKRRPLRIMNF